jgi:hypothetical protein
MARLFLIGSILAASTAAIAHTSSVPHVHPHEVSVLPDLFAMLVAAAIVACGVFAFRKFGRKP